MSTLSHPKDSIVERLQTPRQEIAKLFLTLEQSKSTIILCFGFLFWKLQCQHLECGDGRTATSSGSACATLKASVSSHLAVLPNSLSTLRCSFQAAATFLAVCSSHPVTKPFFHSFQTLPPLFQEKHLQVTGLAGKAFWSSGVSPGGSVVHKPDRPLEVTRGNTQRVKKLFGFQKRIKRNTKRLDSGTVDGIKTALENLR